MSLLLTRGQVVAILRAHDAGPPDEYGRCVHCNWARHPCKIHDLAADWLAMDDLTEMVLTMATIGLAHQHIAAAKRAGR